MTDVEAVRLLIGDTGTTQTFTDAQIAQFNSLAGVSGPGSEYFFAAAIGLRALASSSAGSLTEVRLGDFSDSSGRNKVTAINAAADAFMKLYYETPAWAIVESNESDLNALVIIRNFVLRTNP
jgi:hypothetical protein